MLSIKILNGKRQGISFQLFSIDKIQQNMISLREDESVIFEVKLAEDLPNLTIVLHETELLYTKRFFDNGVWVYEWHPRESFNRKEPFFHNFCGIAELALAARDDQTSSEFVFFIELNPIEVLAKKINADRISAMFNFLARQDGKDLAAVIRVTRFKAGYKEGGRTESFLLERIEHNLNFLNKVLPNIGSRPIVKLRPNKKLVIPNQDTLIDEDSVSWIIENPNYLYDVTSADESLLTFNNAHYGISQIIENQTERSFDVYENQVLHGFVITLITATKNIQARLNTTTIKPTYNSDNEGYVSLFTQLGKFSSILNKNKIDKCNRIITELSRVLVWLRQKIPVRKYCLGVPRFTQKAKYNLIYQQIFGRMISWHRYGSPDWGFQDELNSIKDIPRLFEYYLLCVIKFHLENLGSEEHPITHKSGNFDNEKIEYSWKNTDICLMYEPDIWAVGHPNSNSKNLVNSEGWTLKNNTQNSFRVNNIEIKKKGFFGEFAKRCPDVMIEVIQQNADPSYFIIDAKYTDSKRAFLNYLPELTMKYIHGIHKKNSGKSLSTALMIVNPDETPNTRHYHHHEYSIYGQYPISPALLVSSIDVANAHDNNSKFRSDLTKVIELMMLPLSR